MKRDKKMAKEKVCGNQSEENHAAGYKNKKNRTKKTLPFP